MKSSRDWMSAAIIFVLAVLGVIFFRIGYVIFASGEGRNPAAIPRIYDYSNLEGASLYRAAQDRLAGGMKIVYAGNSTGLELGHFMTKNSNGATVSACEVYDQIELQFVGSGMAVSGESPLMTVDGPCLISSYDQPIIPLMIDYSYILEAPVREQEFEDQLGQAVTLTFENVSDSWPREWVLQSVRLHGSDPDEVIVTAEDIRRVLGKAPTMEWR